jgi:hypothetical protein
LPPFLFGFLCFSETFEHLDELVVPALLPVEIGLSIILADIPPKPAFQSVFNENAIVSLADKSPISAITAMKTAVIVEQ